MLKARDLFLAVSGGGALAGAWLLPGSVPCVILGWIAAFFLVFLARQAERPYLTAYLIGIISHIFAFHWIFWTIKDFGGFDFFATSGIFLLFIVLSPLQFPIYVLFFRNATFCTAATFGLLPAAAWAVSETVSVRIFPWALGHTQLAFHPMSGLASLGGATLVSFVMMWAAELLITRRVVLLVALITAIGVHTAILPGHFTEQQKKDAFGVMVVQANISIEEKHNMKLIVSNRERYLDITNREPQHESLVIWPETVIQDWVPVNVGRLRHHPALPSFSDQTSFLSGALMYDEEKHLYNSALMILPDGTVPPPYHKRILMPFGEYTPLGNIFPWLQEINATAGGFTAGESTVVFRLPSGVGIAPLICYEDILPRLSREATNAGAQVLVNLTNDAWFGDTVASHQHHLIAAFRAIENRRYLIRSTNTGFTAVVNELGESIASLPVYSEGVLRTSVVPSSETTLFMRLGDWPWWILSALFIFKALLAIRKRDRHRKGDVTLFGING